MREQKPSWVSKLHGFSAATLDSIDRNGNVEGAFIVSGTSSDGAIGWLARGSALEVFTLSTGARIAAWCFGAILKDPATRITTVTEYRYDNSIKLLIATTTPSTNAGMLCLFDVKTSKVIRAVDIPYKVTSTEVVTSVGCARAPAHILSDHLRHFCGIVALGTHCGHIYLLDMCLDDDEEVSDELSACGLVYLDPHTKDVASKRYNAISKGKHLCLELGEEAHNRGYYEFRKPDSSVVRTYSADNVYVSSLMFTQQTGLLSIGFSFGCFQLWRLHIPVLEYTSRFEEDLYPVTRFAYQEPENDPRNFSYIWVCRGPDLADDIGDATSNIALFQLGFNRKIWYDEFGYLFEELVSVGPKFEHFLTSDPFNLGETADCGSRLISCYTVKDPRYRLPDRTVHEDSFDEGAGGQDLSLCVLVWEAETSEAHSRNVCFLGLFDMNRWYHTQMPPALRCSAYSREVCPYFAFYSMEDVLEVSNPDSVLALYLDHSSISKFISPMVPAPEQHFYPASLAFGGSCIMETGVVRMKCLGIQRQILADIQSQGPGSLLEPSDLYNLCLFAGLMPRSFEHATGSGASMAYRREAILSASLDHNLVGFIMACIAQWAAGDHASVGCTLKALLEWAWRKVTSIKESLDHSWECLYDWSGMQFDPQTIQVLHHQQVALSHMVTIFQALFTQVVPSTEQGRLDLETKLSVVTLINQHLQMVLWFYSKGFLPECPEKVSLEKAFPYPAQALTEAYHKRRADVQKLHSELRPTDLLLIDGILQTSGAAILNLWEKDGGSGLFPPPSLYATLNMYLLENVSLRTKNMVVFYLLCEFLANGSEDQHPELNQKLQQFCHAFSLPPSTSKFVQGIWLLDHKEFEDCLLYLLDPSIQSDISPWQHTRIIKAFLYQGHTHLALKYIRVKRPAMLTREDVKLRLTVLLANGLISEAFEFQRICRDQLSCHDLLSHLFLGCQQTKTMDQLLQLPFSEEEERHLVSFLHSSSDPNVKELLVLYYLQRARFTDAIRLNTQLQETFHTLDVTGRERATVRNCIVEGYRRVMPAVQRKLALAPEKPATCRTRNRREFARPTPLSAFVNKSSKAQTITRASLIHAVLEKVNEVKDRSPDLEVPQEVVALSPRPDVDHDREPPTVPFIGTPVIQRKARGHCTDSREVVFPMTTEYSPPCRDHAGLSGISPAASPNKLPYAVPSPLRLDATSLAQSFLQGHRRIHKLQSAEALSLLQTPPIKRKSPSRQLRPHAELPETPQSILKSRHKSLLRASISVPDAFKPSAASTVLPSQPRLQSKSLYPELPTEPSETDSLPGTPKKLRFSEPFKDVNSPEKERTPSPVTVNKPTVRVSLLDSRSAKDQSPSQERQSEPAASSAKQVVEVTELSDSGSEQEIYDELDMEEDTEEALLTASKVAFDIPHRELSHVPEESEVVTLDSEDEEGEVAMTTEEEEETAAGGDGGSEHYQEKISRWQQLIHDCDICREFEKEKGCIHMPKKPAEVEEAAGEEMETQSEEELEEEEEEQEAGSSQSEEHAPSSGLETGVPVPDVSKTSVMIEREETSETDEVEIVFGERNVVSKQVVSTVSTSVQLAETQAPPQPENVVADSELEPQDNEGDMGVDSETPVFLQLELSPDKKASVSPKEAESQSEKAVVSEPEQPLEESFEVVFTQSAQAACDKYTMQKPAAQVVHTAEEKPGLEAAVVTPPVTSRRVTRSSSVKQSARPTVVKRQSKKSDSISEPDTDSLARGDADRSSQATSPRRRGRPRKTDLNQTDTKTSSATTPPKSPGRRGRPRKSEVVHAEPSPETEPLEASVSKSPGRRGRPRKSEVNHTPVRQSVRIQAREIYETEGGESPTRETSKKSSKTPSPKSSAAAKSSPKKTPPKPTRVSVMPPTPPKSTTPESVSSHDAPVVMETEHLLPRLTRSQSRSRSNSPEMEIDVKVKMPSRRSTRRTSSMSSSVAEETPVMQTSRRTKRSGTRSSVSPSGGESEKGETSATDNTDVESVTSDHHGPLSRGSFMHKLRSGRRSREGTPEPRQLSELESEEEFDRLSFTFSNPLAVEFNNGGEAGSRPETPPVHSFVFSPPLTRSRRQSLTVQKSVPGIALFSDNDITVSTKTALVTEKRSKRAKTKKVLPGSDSAVYLPSDSPVYLLSPVPEDELSKASSHRAPLTRSRVCERKVGRAPVQTRKLRWNKKS